MSLDIARVNRVYNDTKKYGLVVDYYGVNLAEALAIYDEVDTESAWFDIADEIPKLRDRQTASYQFIHSKRLHNR